jgi:RHS repeat-associated protein
MLTDENGVAVWAAIYDPFGKATVNNDLDGDGMKLTLNQRFPGQYYDAESGLHYNYHRYYDPETGRYITSDPIGLDGGLNTYGYVGGNPIKHFDPNGLWSLTIQAYTGPGGAINISYFDGTLEVTGRIGVGLGIGIEYDPLAEPSPHAKSCGNGYIARTTTQLGVNYGFGVAAVGAGFIGSSGNAVTHKAGGGYLEINGPQVSANVGVDIGSYSNW